MNACKKIKKTLSTIIFLAVCPFANGQTKAFADSIRVAYKIPEIGYAVVSSTEVLELQTLGVKKVNTFAKAETDDKFRIGSNTKAVTGFIAAQLVKQKKIDWDTKFFDLFPELKEKSRQAYHDLTLLNLLSFRSWLIPYTYTYSEPVRDQFTGGEGEQRYQFARWFFQQKPVKNKDSFNFSNLGYVAAGQMLEKVSGKPYKKLVQELGTQLGIEFGFGNPNAQDTLQPWGHGPDLIPEVPGDNYKLNWLLPAGNINISLPDYTKFIQVQLLGLAGRSRLLTKEEFYFLHFGLPRFAVGWFWQQDESRRVYSYNIGNPGTFLTKVFVYPDNDRAFILFANAQTTDTDSGLDILYHELKESTSKNSDAALTITNSVCR